MDRRKRAKFLGSLDSSKDQIARELTMLSGAHRALAQAGTVEEVKKIRDKAEAARIYAKSAMLSLEKLNHCAEIKLRAERKAGQLLAELHLSPGRPSKERWSSHATILKELGINKSQSSRWQREARVPEAIFLIYLCAMHEQAKEITADGLLRLAQQAARSKNGANVRDKKRRARQRAATDAERAALTGDTDTCAQTLSRVCALVNHRKLLASLLEPYCTKEIVRSELVERRTVARILAEMEEILAELGEMVQADS